ncbi:hypothetical protein CERZMDRAFT_114826 [Cercospora zeae-maydis SCOH1-5]|uniref:Uncharacterized protein n=1 Tax=Cercospora zeae-maydis SCOH1-5 TaxID=717836 RepID=A0A6A6F698_9PEZI|nr:hypothetical protein CERZMDRAFT_114826 [Cercospora zeae-maydis SCOH1-5]
MSSHGLSPQQIQILLQQLKQQEQQQQWFRVFKPEIDSVAHDPIDPVKRYHDGIFVELDRTTGEGTFFHVTGDIIAARGMRYEERDGFIPGQSGRLHQTTQLGWVLKTDFDSGRISSILRALPTPTKQQGVNFWKKSTIPGEIEIIWTKENGEPYGPNEPRRPVMKCNEWTDLAASTLRSQGVLRSAS